MHGALTGHGVDDRGEVVGESLGPVRRSSFGHSGIARPAIVVADDAEPVREQWHNPVPQAVGIGIPVRQDQRGPVCVPCS